MNVASYDYLYSSCMMESDVKFSFHVEINAMATLSVSPTITHTTTVCAHQLDMALTAALVSRVFCSVAGIIFYFIQQHNQVYSVSLRVY